MSNKKEELEDEIIEENNEEETTKDEIIEEKLEDKEIIIEDNAEIIDYDIDDGLENEVEEKVDVVTKEKEPLNVKKEIFSWVKMLLTAAILAFVITQFIIINATVPTESMEDTIPTDSRIMGLRLTYLFHEPERLDVIVFKYQFEDKNYVKRVIGLPGETVIIENAKINIYKGDELVTTLDESDYLKEEWERQNDGYTFTVPENSYFVLGDNRNNSSDTRDWYEYRYKKNLCNYEDLFIKESAILGKVYFTYYPSFSFID